MTLTSTSSGNLLNNRDGNLVTASGEHDHLVLAAIVNASEDAILSKTLDGIITTWNPAAERMFGYTAEEIIGQPKTILFPPERLQEEADILNRLRHGIPTPHFETVRLRKNDLPLHVSISVSPIKDSKGHVIGASTIARDITQRKMAEIEHRQQEQFVSAILDTVGAPVIVLDIEGRILRFNHACERITGWTFAEVEGKLCWDILILPEEVEALRPVFAQLCAGDFPLQYENHWRTRNGDKRYITFSNTALVNDDGSIQAIIGTGLDITEQRTAEAANRHSEARYRGVVELCPDALLVHQDCVLLFANPAALRLFGATYAAQMLGKNLLDFVHPDTRALVMQRVQSLQTAEQETPASEQKWFDLHGHPLEVEVRGNACDWQGQRAVQMIVRDIREGKLAEQQRQEDAERLRVSEERYALSVEGSQNGLWDWDIHTGKMHVSARSEQMIGYAGGELPHYVEAWTARLHPDDRPRVAAEMGAYFRRETDVYEIEFRLRHKDGSYRWILSRGVALFDSEGKPYRMAGSHMDITERKRLVEQLQIANEWQNDAIEQLTRQRAELRAANDRLEALATTDSLTGLKNHRALQERFKEEYDRALRYTTPFSILMLDVDNFKQYNDTYGHPAGDGVLRQVAQVLQETARTCDVVARYGGEEFVVLLPGADVEEVKMVAEQLRHAVETVTWPKRAITVSIGAATLTPTTLHPDALLANADTALYRSKHRGRNCVTHANDAPEGEGLDTEAAGWADALFHKLLAVQKDQAGKVSEQVRESLLPAYDATILSWSRILDLKDKETEGHSERVTELMVRLTQSLGFNSQEMRLARWGALLHDIGKIAVPDHILHKAGPLTEEEWGIMRQHTSIAYEMLQPIEFLGTALEIPYCHHEKWDGSGYPRGLRGEEIPLAARLFAVIDVYDALTSDRPYRKAWPVERVRGYLREQAETHFDPRAVDAFLNMLQEEDTTQQAA